MTVMKSKTFIPDLKYSRRIAMSRIMASTVNIVVKM